MKTFHASGRFEITMQPEPGPEPAHGISLQIRVEGSQHFYDFDFTLP